MFLGFFFCVSKYSIFHCLQKDVVYLFQFAPAEFSFNASPFTLKVEAYLRFAGINHEIVKGNHLPKSPKNKLPFIGTFHTFFFFALINQSKGKQHILSLYLYLANL